MPNDASSATTVASASRPRVSLRPGKRQRGRLHDDGDARSAPHERPRAPCRRAGSARRPGPPPRCRRRASEGAAVAGRRRRRRPARGRSATPREEGRGACLQSTRRARPSCASSNGPRAATRGEFTPPATLVAGRWAAIDSTSSAEDADRRGARPRRRPRARRGALPRRRQQPRLPRLLRAPRGAADDRRPADERAPRLHEHALQAPVRLPAARCRGRVGHASVHRKEIDAEYKADRRSMPDLLREQFPHFRPIVEAFGYQNLEFEGWEADDVIATLATQADEAGVKTCVVSTDRDAFQLVSENVCLMMTPRGVADVQVYTPERVEARYGIRPDQIPDFIGLKGDTSDNIPGIPGIGDKTAGQLSRSTARSRRSSSMRPSSRPRGSRAIAENAEQARASKLLATMRRDLDLGCRSCRPRPAAARPLRAQGDLPALRVPRPPRAGRHARRGAARGGAAAPCELGDGPLARGRARRSCAAASASPPTPSAWLCATASDGGRRRRSRATARSRTATTSTSSRTTRSRCGSASLPPTTRCSPRT